MSLVHGAPGDDRPTSAPTGHPITASSAAPHVPARQLQVYGTTILAERHPSRPSVIK